MAQTLHFHVPPWQFDMLRQPRHIFGRVAEAAARAGWHLALHGEDDPPSDTGLHLIVNRPVLRPNTLVLRRCGFEPFYRIEQTNDRWDWSVAGAGFATDKGGEWFRRYWQGELFRGLDIVAGGYAFMPLQGRLLQRRHFQSASPVEMIEIALKCDSLRPIKATLHPRESYTNAERAALREIESASLGRFQVVDAPSIPLLAGCDYVVTQNSTLALIGMFAAKMPILFAEIDFHHLAGSVPHLGLKRAFRHIGRPRRWGAYLHWYFKENAISSRSDDAAQAILARMAALGWPAPRG